MKSKKFALLSLLMLGSISLSSCYLDLGFIQIGEKEDSTDQGGGGSGGDSGNYDSDSQAEINAYYASIGSQSGESLLSALRSVIHTSSVVVGYDWSRYEKADEDPSNSTNVLLIYARTSYKKSAHVRNNVGWNREHTFPQSKLQDEQATNDTHIIYASDCAVNSTRSNYKLGVVTNGSVVYDSYGNTTQCRLGNSKFDPNNEARGIVARSTMYAAAMYGYDPTDNFESLATMLKWHLDYPVTKFDTSRNSKVYKLQKNRNPFVDHPEYACKIWGSKNSATKAACGM